MPLQANPDSYSTRGGVRLTVGSPPAAMTPEQNFALRSTAPGVIKVWKPDSYAVADPYVKRNGMRSSTSGGPAPWYDVNDWPGTSSSYSFTHPINGNLVPWRLDTTDKVSGVSSYHASYHSNPPIGTDGSYCGQIRFNFSDDVNDPNLTQAQRNAARKAFTFTPTGHPDPSDHSKLYLQWHHKASDAMFDTYTGTNNQDTGHKQLIIDPCDQKNGPPWTDLDDVSSCDDMEIVAERAHSSNTRMLINGKSVGLRMYHSCGNAPLGNFHTWTANGRRTSGPFREPRKLNALAGCNWADGGGYQDIHGDPCMWFLPDTWGCFEVEVDLGVAADYSTCRLRWWVSPDRNLPPTLVADTGYGYGTQADPWQYPIFNPGANFGTDGDYQRYGKIWLLNFISHKDSAEQHPNVAETWWDEVIISSQPIPFPNDPTNQTLPALSAGELPV